MAADGLTLRRTVLEPGAQRERGTPSGWPPGPVGRLTNGPAELDPRRDLAEPGSVSPDLDPPLGTRQAAYELRPGRLPSMSDRQEPSVRVIMSIVLLRPTRDVPALAAGSDNAGV